MVQKSSKREIFSETEIKNESIVSTIMKLELERKMQEHSLPFENNRENQLAHQWPILH